MSGHQERGRIKLKRVHDWNKAAIIRHLWNIASNSHTIWASWINSYLLKGRSEWGIPMGYFIHFRDGLRLTKEKTLLLTSKVYYSYPALVKTLPDGR